MSDQQAAPAPAPVSLQVTFPSANSASPAKATVPIPGAVPLMLDDDRKMELVAGMDQAKLMNIRKASLSAIWK